MKQSTTGSRQRQASEQAPIRERWSACPPGESDEALAGALLRSAAVVQPFEVKNPADVGGTRLRGRAQRGTWAWQVAIAIALLLCGGALFAAVTHILRRPSGAAVEHVSAGAAPAGKPSRRVAAVAVLPPAANVLSPQVLAPGPAPVPRPLADRTVSSTVTRERTAAALSAPLIEPPPAEPPAPSALGQESRLVARAITKLRQDGEPEAALAALDEHSAQFGAHGALAPEANATRIEALLRIGRHAEALVLLDALVPTAAGVGREMLVARAELRGEKGRCSAALNDFGLLLDRDEPADLVTERALFGRASCRAQKGDPAGTRADLEHYLATFPTGRFAEKARLALGR